MSLILQIADDATITTLGRIAEGDQGTDQTAAAVWGVVKASAADALVRRRAKQIGTPERLYAFLRAHTRFSPDPRGVEMIRVPAMLLRQINRTGTARCDCDDLAALGASLLAAMGRTPVLSVVGATERELGGRFQHIFFGYAAPGAVGGVVLMDPQEGFAPGGLPTFPRARLYWATEEHAA